MNEELSLISSESCTGSLVVGLNISPLFTILVNMTYQKHLFRCSPNLAKTETLVVLRQRAKSPRAPVTHMLVNEISLNEGISSYLVQMLPGS